MPGSNPVKKASSSRPGSSKGTQAGSSGGSGGSGGKRPGSSGGPQAGPSGVKRPGSSGGSATTAGGPPPPPPPGAAPRPQAPKPPTVTLPAGQITLKDAPGYHRVWLCCYAGGLFKGHWIMFIESQTTPDAGTTIHAQGDPKTGFKQEFQRVSRQPWKSDRRPGYYDLGLILKSWITPEGPYTAGRTTADVKPYNKLETLALQVEAPGPSLRSATDPATKQRLTQENCQTYIKNLVNALLAQSHEGGHPVFIISRPDVLDLAPKQ